MDTFFEQIVTIRVEGKKLFSLIFSWIIALLACIGIIVLSMFVPIVLMVIVLAIVGILMGTYKLCQKFFIEYEYIVTNNSLDIDTIIARNNRKRLITVDIPSIISFSKFDQNKIKHKQYNKTYFCANEDDELYMIEYKHRTQGNVLIIFAPNEKIIGAIKRTAPRVVCNIWRY